MHHTPVARTARARIGLLAVIAGLCFLFAVIGPTTPVSGDPTRRCGVERWSVKTGTDPDAQFVDLSSVWPVAMSDMVSWLRPGYIPPNNRIDPYEDNLLYIEAFLVQYKLETDEDYHLVIVDGAGNTMIAEIPNPSCVAGSSPFADYIANARAEFDAAFTVSTSWRYTYTPVQIFGMGMFDYNHGQTGHAPNFVEIHPVLDIQFP
jgi:hypothetical protein